MKLQLNKLTRLLRGDVSETEETELNTADSEQDGESEEDLTDDSEDLIQRPPGWGDMYGTYEKPIIPVSNDEVIDVVSKLDDSVNFCSVNLRTPEMGTNKEHILLHLYTLLTAEKSRKFVIDVYINEFSEWLPEEKGRFSYPESSLGENGPYYMHLDDNLEQILKLPPFSFNLVEYDEDEDLAIFSAEATVFPLQDN